jgi:hypothetical protein
MPIERILPAGRRSRNRRNARPANLVYVDDRRKHAIADTHKEQDMVRTATLAAALLVAGTALADIAPPIPKGFKSVPLSHKIVTEAAFPDYTLFVVENAVVIGKATRTAAPAKLDTKTPLTLNTSASASVSRSYELVAVPKDAAKGYATEKEFLEAVAAGKVAGLVKSKTVIAGGASTNIKEGDPRKEVVAEYKIEKIDAKDGIVFGKEKADPNVPPPPGCDTDDEGAAPSAYAPKGGTWVAGLAGALAVVFGGLWVARRGRRELA